LLLLPLADGLLLLPPLALPVLLPAIAMFVIDIVVVVGDPDLDLDLALALLLTRYTTQPMIGKMRKSNSANRLPARCRSVATNISLVHMTSVWNSASWSPVSIDIVRVGGP